MSRMSRANAILAALVLLLGLGAPALAEDEHPGHLMVLPDQLEWKAVASMPAGARAAVLEGDPSKEQDFTMRIEFPANYTIPLHTHPAVERVTVLSGTLYFAVGDTFDRQKAQAVPAGSLAVMDAGVPMYGFTGDEPVVIQLNSTGPWGIEYLNPDEDPRQASE
ncbi:MAG TPA: cupin domain-containing protein [Thermoanaerobaculia bacterium]|nr:cupin domain-containing protein [Thermoanaerobaculia bacterium]